ncbi:MAG: hypothetical protein JWR74_498 [Polaromonas sp.]|nr:hypothetical protein [Polaromonas sp.]
MRLWIHAVLSVIAWLMPMAPSHAALDGMETVRAGMRADLRWENVRGAPYWVAGPLPAADKHGGWHAVNLDAAAGIALHLPAHAMLRVVASAGSAATPPVFALSQGTGLAIETEAVRASDGRSWLLKTGTVQPAVVHLRAPEGTAPQRVALFIARFELPPEPVAYRHELALPGPAVEVRRADEAAGRRHVQVAAGQEVAVTVNGPDRLLLEYRLAAGEAPPKAIPALQASLGLLAAQLVRQPTGPETVAPVRVDGAWQASARLERFTLELPPGEHALRLRASHAVLLRAATARLPDLLLPGLNLPEGWAALAGNAALEAAEQESVAAAASNRWRDIGMLAPQRLQREARALPALPAVQGAADELQGQFTQFHDLVPATAGTVRTLAVSIRQPQPVNEAARHHIAGPNAAASPEPPPTALFHRLTNAATRYELPAVAYPLRVRALVPANADPARIEVRHGDGTVTTLLSGMPALANERLRPGAGDLAAIPTDLWLPGLGGRSDRLGQAAPVSQVAAVDWVVPANARTIELRSLANDVELALQWAGSTEYFPDDQLLAAWVATRDGPEPLDLLRQDALRPLQSRVEAARAQYVANVSPPPAHSAVVDEAVLRQAVQAAARESDTARAVELWQQALPARDPTLRARALQGLAQSLFAAGERFTGERLLRSHWTGPDPVLARVAQVELEALYQREGDLAMQLLFAAAQSARDPAAYGALSALLAADGEDRLALLAGLAAPQPALPALLQSALRSRYPTTFDALLARLTTPAQRDYWQTQRLLSYGGTLAANAFFQAPGDGAWNEALRTGRDIALALHGEPTGHAGAVAAWTGWQARHPGPHWWRAEAGAVLRHGGGLRLRSVPLNLRSQWWRASTRQPLVVQVAGPARIRIEARPLHADASSLLDGWLQVQADGQLWLMPFHHNQASPGLELDTGGALPGAAVTREIDLPAGLHTLNIASRESDVAARLLVARPTLQLPVLPAPAAAHFMPHVAQVARLVPAPWCGAGRGCQLVTGAKLEPFDTVFETVSWQGLPPAAAIRDPLAQKLANGDVEGALAWATDPREKMRLLLWMAQVQAGARARALALGSAVASAHPLPEIRSQWEWLSQGSGWVTLPLVDRSAGLRRIETMQGTPESPGGRIRAALMAPLRPGEIRLGADSRATLAYAEADALTVDAQLTLDDLPGMPTLPIDVQVELNARVVRTVRLNTSQPGQQVRVRVPPGNQALSISLKQPYPNQFVRVRFASRLLPEPLVTRDWHIATRTQPVQVTVAGPVAVRIDRLDSDGVRSEERLLTEPIATFTLAPQPGAAESLYRIAQRLADPLPAQVLPPRPNNYAPTPMPEPPDAWSLQSRPQAPRQVSFVDAEPLARPAGTWTARAGLHVRRHTEDGGDDLPLSERFAESGLTWRQGSDDQTQWLQADFLWRKPARASPVFGLRLSAEQEMRWFARFAQPLRLKASMTAFGQNTPDGRGAAATARVAVSQLRPITPTLSHELEVGLVARAMNLERTAYADQVDSDVFSAYRVNHRRALVLSETLSWRPWRDSHLAAQAAVTTNPDFNPLRPDQLSLDLSWRQLAGPVRIEAGMRTTRFQADQFRPESELRRQWRLLLSAERWLDNGTRLELLSHLRADVGRSNFVGGVELRWHWGGARHFRDFSPSEIDFRALRTWRAPTVGNRIEEQ